MAKGRALTIDITTADAQTIAALKRIQKELKDTGQVADRTSKQGLSLGSALGGLAIGAGITKAVGEFEEAETTLRKTEAVIKSTGNAAGISAEQQAKMVDQFSKLAAVDDEVVAGGANILRTFTQIKGEAFEPALGAALDLSAALGTDLQSATLQVGKALNDPIKGVTALTRAGVSFTAQQKEQIKAMQGAGDIAGAQRLILQELETQFGGQAEAAATDSARMRVAFDDAAESLGGALAPALTAAAGGAQKASAAFQAMPEALQQIAIAGGAAAIVGPRIAEGVSAAATSLSALRAAAAEGGGGLKAVISTAASSPLAWGAAAAGVGGLVWAFSELKDGAEEAQRASEALAKSATDAGRSATEQFRMELANTLAGVEGGLDALGDNSNVESARKSFEELGLSADEMGTALLGTDQQYQDYLDTLKLAREEQIATEKAQGLSADQVASNARNYEILVGEMGLMRAQGLGAIEVQNRLTQVQRELGVETNGVTSAIEGATGAMGDYLANSKGIVDAQEAVASTGEAVNKAIVGVAEAQDRVADAEGQVATAREAVADAEDAVANARDGVAAAEENLADAHRGVEQAQRGVTDAEKDAVAAREGVVEATEALAQAQADALIDSEYMADALQGVTDAEEKLALSQADSQEAQEALTEARAGYSTVLADLAANAAGAADDVLSAEIRLREAQQALATLGQDGKPVSADDRTKAEIAVREAQRRVDEARRRATEAAEEERRQREAGVEGSDAVVAAQDAVAEAAGRQEDAQRALEDAVTNVADTQEEANNRVADAQDNLAEAIDKRAAADQRVVDARQGVVDANRAVQKAAEGVRDANGQVAAAIDGVRDAQQRVTDAKEGVKTARGEVEAAERKVEEAVRDQYEAYKALSDLYAPGSAARTRMEWLTEQLRLQHEYLPQSAPDWFTSIWKSSSGPKAGEKSGGPTFDKPGESTGPTMPTVPPGWVKQPNGRWYHPRMPGEANYGDGYTDEGPSPEITRQLEVYAAWQAEQSRRNAAEMTPGPLNPAARSVTINVNGADDPAAIAEWIYQRAGWELSLMGVA